MKIDCQKISRCLHIFSLKISRVFSQDDLVVFETTCKSFI